MGVLLLNPSETLYLVALPRWRRMPGASHCDDARGLRVPTFIVDARGMLSWVRVAVPRFRSVFRLRSTRIRSRHCGPYMGGTASKGTSHRRDAEVLVESVQRVALELRHARQRTPHVLSDAYEAEARQHVSALMAVVNSVDVAQFELSESDLVSAVDGAEHSQDVSLPEASWPEECGWPTRRIQYVFGAEQSDLFSVGVFYLPKGAYLPLHDHFGMVVVSRVLWGSLVMRAFDFATEHYTNYEELEWMHCNGGWAESTIQRSEREAGDAWALYPRSGGNIHELVAVREPCAMLDIIMPPYPSGSTIFDRRKNRELYECHYYRATRKRQPGDPSRTPEWFLERFPGEDLVYVQRARQRLFPDLWR